MLYEQFAAYTDHLGLIAAHNSFFLGIYDAYLTTLSV